MSNLSAKSKAGRIAEAQWQSNVLYHHPEGWLPGSPVNVSAARTEGRRGLSFTYEQHVTNLVTGSEWIDVKDKDGAIWAFKSNEVELKIIKPKRKYTKRK